jgi:SAM-dependent methyltransferase
VADLRTPVQPNLAGLDFDFLRYIGTQPESQRRIQAFYLPFFAGCRRVVDLGCGDGDFLALLREQGIEAVGVDADDKTFAATQAAGLPVIHQDVFGYLATAAEASVDGVFCAHLVEHLPYPQVIELVEQSYRILRPGGRIVLATPDCRSLFSHLEMFYLHFGHVSFYHPRLLCFLLEHAGFGQAELGVNPATASPLLPAARRLAGDAPSATLPRLREIPRQGSGLLANLAFSVKRALARWLVLPFVDSLATATQIELTRLSGDVQQVAAALQSLNGPFECYATAVKPPLHP